VDEILPSVRFEPDNPRLLGFVDEVDEAHVNAIAEALQGVADAVGSVTGGVEPTLRVRFSSLRYMPTLLFVLYSFHILRVNEQGELSDEVAEGDEITYALVAMDRSSDWSRGSACGQSVAGSGDRPGPRRSGF